MEKNTDIVCGCGKIHNIKTKNIIVQKNCLNSLIFELSNNKFKNILIFYANMDDSVKCKISEAVENKNKEITFYQLKDKFYTTHIVEKFEDYKQDLVVAFGDETIISVAKYYAYMFRNEVYVYPIGEFLDFTFSKFSRLSDGLFFDFLQGM